MTESHSPLPDQENRQEEGDGLLSVVLTEEQVALIVFCLMEQSVHVPVHERITWTRLALALNDTIVEGKKDG